MFLQYILLFFSKTNIFFIYACKKNMIIPIAQVIISSINTSFLQILDQNCTKEIHPGDSRFYVESLMSRIEIRPCPPGTIFVSETCGCTKSFPVLEQFGNYIRSFVTLWTYLIIMWKKLKYFTYKNNHLYIYIDFHKLGDSLWD